MLNNDILPIDGIRLSSVAAGIRYSGRNDLLLIELAQDTRVAAVFTRNAFCAAPVVLARKHLHKMPARYLLINSGNANAGTGQRGLQDALSCCDAVAQVAGIQSQAVLPFSTGVIGEYLPLKRITGRIPQLFDGLQADAWQDAAHTIMTTDSVAKCHSMEVDCDGHIIRITGMAKGSGMICPNMATMLAYIATDARIEQNLLNECLQSAVADSFNSITVDGDTSTNDACVLMASGQSSAPLISKKDSTYESFHAGVRAIAQQLARDIIMDAEGATKLIEIKIEQAADNAEARAVAYTIAHSPLVKTAMFASDPNWGRILAAVGRAPVHDLDVEQVDMWLGDVQIVKGGEKASQYEETQGQQAMSGREIKIRVRLGRGQAESCILSSDLSYDYVKINAEYRT
ncbi:MAG: bifunctional glutamate N-acetyltransferase/amino-acid acetyltransferase ArgJ [gamma proteobacterium symbiont of Bathyaustriella thionipta]|nr:bifunctional glutamate N-acetyltransferase/amino-acid acetyltransferase ArgJ [gamma proteobacterium symbiont of Bathyaustriella thionipta]